MFLILGLNKTKLFVKKKKIGTFYWYISFTLQLFFFNFHGGIQAKHTPSPPYIKKKKI